MDRRAGSAQHYRRGNLLKLTEHHGVELDMPFNNNTVGKLIVFRNTKGAIHLAHKSSNELGYVVRWLGSEYSTFAATPQKYPGASMHSVLGAIDVAVGEHADISCEGTALGGTHFVVQDKVLICWGKSQKFGAARAVDIENALKSTGLTLRDPFRHLI